MCSILHHNSVDHQCHDCVGYPFTADIVTEAAMTVGMSRSLEYPGEHWFVYCLKGPRGIVVSSKFSLCPLRLRIFTFLVARYVRKRCRSVRENKRNRCNVMSEFELSWVSCDVYVV